MGDAHHVTSVRSESRASGSDETGPGVKRWRPAGAPPCSPGEDVGALTDLGELFVAGDPQHGVRASIRFPRGLWSSWTTMRVLRSRRLDQPRCLATLESAETPGARGIPGPPGARRRSPLVVRRGRVQPALRQPDPAARTTSPQGHSTARSSMGRNCMQGDTISTIDPSRRTIMTRKRTSASLRRQRRAGSCTHTSSVSLTSGMPRFGVRHPNKRSSECTT